jgi:hypothetical protein
MNGKWIGVFAIIRILQLTGLQLSGAYCTIYAKYILWFYGA